MTLGVQKIVVGPLDNNVYLVTDADSGERMLVDAAADPEAISVFAGTAPLRWLLTTHSHHDHVGALAELVRAHPEAEVVAGAADADAITTATAVRISRRLVDGDILDLGGHRLDIIELRGHTPGSVAVAFATADGPQIVTGDALFPGGVGNTNRDPVRFASLFADVTSRIFDRYPDETVVLPGHGLPTTLGAERPHLEEWRSRGW